MIDCVRVCDSSRYLVPPCVNVFRRIGGLAFSSWSPFVYDRFTVYIFVFHNDKAANREEGHVVGS
jgi:hypothetical protein